MGKRGPKPPPWDWYQKRYPEPLKAMFDAIAEKWMKENRDKEPSKLSSDA